MEDHMKIKEVEEYTGINSNTLRYYEEQGLINPKRNASNSYREYSKDDVQLLLRIKFLRNLKIPIKVIADILNRTITTQAAVQETLIELRSQKEDIELSIKLLEMLEEETEIASHVYTNKVFDFYKPHPIIKFFDSISDFLSRNFPLLRMGFLPEEGINTKEDFILELIQYAKREDKKLEILDNSTMPNVIVNDIPMQAVLVPTRYGLNYRVVKFKVKKKTSK